MKKFISYQLTAIVLLIVSIYTFVQILLTKNELNMGENEILLNTTIGIAAGILLFIKNNLGYKLAIVWSSLQIFYYLSGDKVGVNFAFYFIQSFKLTYGFTRATSQVLNPLAPYTIAGINFVGIAFLLLTLFTKKATPTPKRKS